MPPNERHWHIVAVGPQLAIPPVLENREENARAAYHKMVYLIHDTTDLEYEFYGALATLFSDSSTVRIFHCDGDCMKKGEQTNGGSEDRPYQIPSE